jgi:membrane protein YqaA with SNARE-associated domain
MPIALLAALAWGFAEATLFFIVPDVLLTLLALWNPRGAIEASIAALAGALIGGCVMYAWGQRSPDQALATLLRVPAIKQGLIDSVRSEINSRGVVAILVGPLRGIPYKIYAVEWAAQRRSFASFLLISIPARYVRFVLVTLACIACRGFVTPMILTIIWIGIYFFYFRKVGA